MLRYLNASNSYKEHTSYSYFRKYLSSLWHLDAIYHYQAIINYMKNEYDNIIKSGMMLAEELKPFRVRYIKREEQFMRKKQQFHMFNNAH